LSSHTSRYSHRGGHRPALGAVGPGRPNITPKSKADDVPGGDQSEYREGGPTSSLPGRNRNLRRSQLRRRTGEKWPLIERSTPNIVWLRRVRLCQRPGDNARPLLDQPTAGTTWTATYRGATFGPSSRKFRQRQQPKSPAAVRGQVKQGKQTAENPASLLRISYACGSRAAGLSLVRKGANGPGRHTGLLRLTPTMVDAEIAASGSPASSSDGAAGGAEGRPLVPAAMVRGAACGLAPISLERSGRAAWREPSCARSLHAVSALLRAAGAF
jgi:hypothetical protein